MGYQQLWLSCSPRGPRPHCSTDGKNGTHRLSCEFCSLPPYLFHSFFKWMKVLMIWGALSLSRPNVMESPVCCQVILSRPWATWDVYMAGTLMFPFVAAPPASRCELNAPCDPSPLPLLNSCFKNSLMRGLLAQLEVFIKTH